MLSWNKFLGDSEKVVQHLSFLIYLPTLVSATMLLEKLQFPHPNQEQKLDKFFRTPKIFTNKKTFLLNPEVQSTPVSFKMSVYQAFKVLNTPVFNT